jgi:preprotein translocase subunit SecE
VARSSRQQRRARRNEEPGEARAASRAVPAREAPRAQEAPRVVAPRGGFTGFVRESAAELQKVEWPSRAQVTTGTVVVIIAVVIVGFYLWVADQAFKNLVEKVII